MNDLLIRHTVKEQGIRLYYDYIMKIAGRDVKGAVSAFTAAPWFGIILPSLLHGCHEGVVFLSEERRRVCFLICIDERKTKK